MAERQHTEHAKTRSKGGKLRAAPPAKSHISGQKIEADTGNATTKFEVVGNARNATTILLGGLEVLVPYGLTRDSFGEN